MSEKKAPGQQPCVWEYKKGKLGYFSTHGRMGAAKVASYRFCPYCGKPIQWKGREDE